MVILWHLTPAVWCWHWMVYLGIVILLLMEIIYWQADCLLAAVSRMCCWRPCWTEKQHRESAPIARLSMGAAAGPGLRLRQQELLMPQGRSWMNTLRKRKKNMESRRICSGLLRRWSLILISMRKVCLGQRVSCSSCLPWRRAWILKIFTMPGRISWARPVLWREN